MNVINLTPHALDLVCNDGLVMHIEASGVVARCAERRNRVGEVAGMVIERAEFGAIEGLPDPQTDTIFIVSTLVLTALKGVRPDVFSPGKAIRDDAGRIIGANGLSTL